MGFWLIAGALALVVGGLMAQALVRARLGTGAAQAFDVQVYRDQLSEVERDLARGVLGQAEAERVRVEVSRRLLDADRAAAHTRSAVAAPRGLSRLAAGVVVLAVLAGAVGVYWLLGAPGYPDLPLAQRIADAEAARAVRMGQAEAQARFGTAFVAPPETDPEFLVLMDKLRAAVADKPAELQGQMLLARNEAMLGNYAAAHVAQGRIIALRGDTATADDHATLADLMILAAQGYVSPEAEAAIDAALQIDPLHGAARYYRGLMYAQNLRPDLAFAIWRPLLEQSRPGAPWVPPILGQISQVTEAAGIRYTPPEMPAPSGPDADDMAEAADMTEAERQEMVRGMVEGLAERLATEGGGPEDWARLIGALGVLGDTERAAAIWAEAQQVFAASPEAVAAIREAAVSAGVAQ